MTQNSISYRVSSDVTFQSVEDTVFLLDMTGSEYFSLNSTGALIWNALAAEQDLEMILEEMVARYPDRARADLDEDLHTLVNELETRSLISPIPISE